MFNTKNLVEIHSDRSNRKIRMKKTNKTKYAVRHANVVICEVIKTKKKARRQNKTE